MSTLETSGARRIESLRNEWVRELREGFRQGDLTRQEHLSIEGEHLLEEARRSGLRIHAIFLREESRAHFPPIEGVRTFMLSRGAFDSAIPTVNSRGIAALIDPPRHAPPKFHLRESRTPLVVIAGGLQDPGNLGTLIRSAEAFGADGMILLPSTVSRWNQKVLRASSGSAFRLPTWPMSPDEAFAILRSNSIRILAAVSRGGDALGKIEKNLTGPIALLLGNEGAGLRPEWLRQVDAGVTIALPGSVESLNAAVAGSILLYEAARQRTEARQ